jgi:hypothetical protein
MGMPDDLRSLVKKYSAFYEVLPYYTVIEEKHGSGGPPITRRIQAGYDVDIYGVNIKHDMSMPGPDPDYRLAFTDLEKIAEEVSHHTGGSCSVEAISFPSTIVIDLRGRWKVEAMFRIRISHFGGLDEPAGMPEQKALEEIKQQLDGVGMGRR